MGIIKGEADPHHVRLGERSAARTKLNNTGLHAQDQHGLLLLGAGRLLFLCLFRWCRRRVGGVRRKRSAVPWRCLWCMWYAPQGARGGAQHLSGGLSDECRVAAQQGSTNG